MKKLYCPQCSVANLYVKNETCECRNIFVTSDYEIITTKEGESLDGFNLEKLYCLGCSWSGTVKKLSKYQLS